MWINKNLFYVFAEIVLYLLLVTTAKLKYKYLIILILYLHETYTKNDETFNINKIRSIKILKHYNIKILNMDNRGWEQPKVHLQVEVQGGRVRGAKWTEILTNNMFFF